MCSSRDSKPLQEQTANTSAASASLRGSFLFSFFRQLFTDGKTVLAHELTKWAKGSRSLPIPRPGRQEGRLCAPPAVLVRLPDPTKGTQYQCPGQGQEPSGTSEVTARHSSAEASSKPTMRLLWPSSFPTQPPSPSSHPALGRRHSYRGEAGGPQSLLLPWGH